MPCDTATTDRLRADSGVLLDALREAGADVQRPNAIRCPFHDDQHPSAGVYRGDDGAWKFKCHGCGFHGDLFDVRAKARNTTPADELKASRGDNAQTIQPARHKASPPKRVFPTLADIEREYPTIQESFQYTNPETGVPDLVVFRQRLADGRKSFIQARPVERGFVLEAPPKPWPLYNRARIAQADRLIVVEGEKCVHTLHAVGIIATTSPAGAGKAAHADWGPLAGRECILWPDCDPPDAKGKRTGIAHMREVAKLLQALDPPARVLWLDPDLLDLPDKGDAADFIERLGDLTTEQQRQAVEDALTEAVPTGPSAEVDELVRDAIAGRRRNVAWPWKQLGSATRALAPATVTLLVASPGATKSLMLIQAAAWWQEHNERIAVLELEDGRAFHLRRALAQRAGESGMTDDEWCQQHPETATAATSQNAEFMDALGVCMHELPGDAQPTLEVIGDWIEQQAIAGKRVIAIDPISIAEAHRDQHIADQKFVARVKRIVENFGCSLLLIMHPKKHAQGRTTDDIAGGAAYGRLAQSVIWLEHTGQTRHVTVMDSTMNLPVPVEVNRIAHLVKTRIGHGQGLRIGYWFDPQTLRLREHGVIVRQQAGDDQ